MYIQLRYNKYIKGLVNDPNRPGINLANATTREASVHFSDLAKSPLYDMHQDSRHTCVLSGRGTHFKPSKEIIGDLMLLHSRVQDVNACVGFPTASIMGVPFTAGEWGEYPRCGSVITCLMGHNERQGPRSVFARVNHFFKVIDDDNPGYASVSWFGEPVYIPRYPIRDEVYGEWS